MRPFFICFLVACCDVSAAEAFDQYAFHHLNVLGTSLELRIDSRTQTAASRAEAIALSEIERLSAIFSSYDDTSELSRWLARSRFSPVSNELREVLDASQRWHSLSKGVFQPGVERLSRMWKQAEQSQQVPTPENLQEACLSLQQIGWEWNSDRSMVRPTLETRLSFNAIAKGAILDAVCAKLSELPDVRGGLLAIGGDMKAFGQFRRTVAIQKPIDDLASPSITEVELSKVALATSSGAFRGVTIGGRKYSHLLDPRTGYPTDQALSVTVIAPRASDADALSTTCSILSPDESLALVDSLPGTACLILDVHGQVKTSSRWSQFEKQPPKLVSFAIQGEGSNDEGKGRSDPDWNGGMELKIDFSINQENAGRRYRRPYVAVWVENKEGVPIRTLVLWAHTTGHGSKWLPDLKRWYRNDRLRTSVDEKDLVKTVSEATRKPGDYSVIWNGEDDNKKLVPPGEYTLFIEAAREHGTYQLIRKKLELADKPFQEKLEDNVEIKPASIDFRKKDKTQKP